MTRDRLLVLVVITLAAAAAAAHASPAEREPAPSTRFVERTQEIRERFAAVAPRTSIRPQWLAADRVVFRVGTPNGGWRHRTRDAGSASIADAFDHERLARALGEGADPDRLDLLRLALVPAADDAAGEPAELVALVGRGPAAVVCTRDGRPAGADARTALAARATGRDRSRAGGPPVSLVVDNRTDAPVRLVWLDGDGGARPYEAVPAGTFAVRTTFAGHVWSVRPDATAGDAVTELVRVIATRDAALVEVTALPPDALSEAAADDAAPDDDDRPEDDHAAVSEPTAPVATPTVRVRFDAGNVVLDGPGGPCRLTEGGTPEDGFGGRVHWSPGRTRFAVMRTRRVDVRRIHFVESSPADGVQPKLHEVPYAKPGDERSLPRPWIFDVATGAAVELETRLIEHPWSLTELHWVDEDRFRLLYNERGHRVVRLVEFDATTGASRTIVEEASDTFVDYPHKILHRRLADGRLLWMSQRTGWNHLSLLDGDTGAVIRPLTAGAWLVRSLASVDEDAGTVLLRVMGIDPDQDPYHVHFVRVELDTGRMVRLTTGDGTHEIERAPGGGDDADALYVARHSRVDLPPVTELRRWSDGALLAELDRASDDALRDVGWRPPERIVAKGRDGATDIWGVAFVPSDFDPSLRYPVIEQIYAGPHGHFVPKSWSAWHGPRELAERGFVVVQIDGMGTNWRSKAFHDVAHRNLADAGFPDRIAWLREAAHTRPWMDLERVGVYGGSAGGQSATRAVFAHGDVYRAAVADCGCHDNRVDKMWWNELWMGYPIGDHYHAQSNANVENARGLTGDLLLIVGEMDRNVDPASTMQVVDALIEADRDFELLVIPGAGHGAAESPYGRRRRAEFFARTLGGPEPVDAARATSRSDR